MTGPFPGARAVEDGRLSADQLRSRAWCRLLRGVYVHRSVEITADVRLAAARLVMPPGTVAAGVLAAWVHGVWSPRPGAVVPLDLTRPVPASGTGHRGLNRRRLTLRGSADWFGGTVGHSALDQDVVEVGGLCVTSPLRTCFDLMRERSLVEAVVVADAFLEAGGVPRMLLAAYVGDRRRWPWVRHARLAVDLCREGSRSSGETRLRMVVVLAGFPEPWINVPVLDGRTGVVLGIPDLRLVGGRPTGLEYDGGYHDLGTQHASDRRRDNRLTTLAGLPLLRYDRISVRDERRTIVHEVQQVSGLRPTNLLDDADFWRPRAARAW